ncbi:MAG TPA: hypothetical protein VK735_21505 [Pseudonocardia sp.]|uniref:hypothetical protein n=1 Tax=Pseudonocardia sp. TaxID=60912 RepID=UPI002BCAA5B8|nr:hypothetical protein [Pseudonocardia sp.]HTF50029.1 hypothetical protein [Pseudonocardia sp.]
MSIPPGGEPPNDPGRSGQPDGFSYPSYPAPSGAPGLALPGGDEFGPTDPLVATDFGGWVSRIIAAVGRSWRPLLLVQGGTALGIALFSVVLGMGGPGSFAVADAVIAVGLVVNLAAMAIAQGASVYVVIRDAAGRPATAGEVAHGAASRAPALIGWTMLSWLLTSMGAFLLFLPGLYLGVVLFAALYGVVMVERKGIGRCFELVHQRFWRTAGQMLLLGVFAVTYTIGMIMVLGLVPGGAESVVFSFLNQLLMVPLMMVLAAAAVVNYAELRGHEHQGLRTTQLADELEPARQVG